MTITLEMLENKVKERFHGVLTCGKHEENGRACALELLSVVKGLTWSDCPSKVGCWDLRPLNDMPVSDELRTRCLLPVLAAYSDSMSWTPERSKVVLDKILILSTQRIVSELPGLSSEIKEKCKSAHNVISAKAACRHAYAYAYAYVYVSTYAFASVYASASASASAYASAYTYAYAYSKELYERICNLWLEAAA